MYNVHLYFSIKNLGKKGCALSTAKYGRCSLTPTLGPVGEDMEESGVMTGSVQTFTYLPIFSVNNASQINLQCLAKVVESEREDLKICLYVN